MIKKSGITLIALVISIVVLIILAGISITTLMGENGLITKTRDSASATESGQEREKLALALADTILQANGGSLTKSLLQTSLDNSIGEGNTTITGDNTYTVAFTESGREYVVKSDGTVLDVPVDKATGNGNLSVGDGTAGNPYLIQSIEDLLTFSKNTNLTSGGNNYSGKTIKLNIDLDFNYSGSYVNANRTDFGDINENGTPEGLMLELITGKGFLPVDTIDWSSLAFAGTFDGNNKSISNLYVNRSGNVGLFGSTNNAEIKNLKLLNTNLIASGSYTGGMIGRVYGNLGITNCSVTGKIESSSSTVGGFIGCLYLSSNNAITINNSYNSANLTAFSQIGGIIGSTDGDSTNTLTIENCYNKGNMRALGDYVGGIIGYPYGIGTIHISKCYNNGNIKAFGSYIGGIVGRGNRETIENCYNTGNITTSQSAGGIIGSYGSGTNTITNCYNLGAITSTSDYGYVGGIFGQVGSDTIANTYNIGAIRKASNLTQNVGGITGDNNYITVLNSYYLSGTAITGLGNFWNPEPRDLDAEGVVESVPDQTAMKTLMNTNLVSIPSSGWKEDTENVNHGYPILDI